MSTDALDINRRNKSLLQSTNNCRPYLHVVHSAREILLAQKHCYLMKTQHGHKGRQHTSQSGAGAQTDYNLENTSNQTYGLMERDLSHAMDIFNTRHQFDIIYTQVKTNHICV